MGMLPRHARFMQQPCSPLLDSHTAIATKNVLCHSALKGWLLLPCGPRAAVYW